MIRRDIDEVTGLAYGGNETKHCKPMKFSMSDAWKQRINEKLMRYSTISNFDANKEPWSEIRGNSVKTIDAMSERLGRFWHDGCGVEIGDGGFMFITAMGMSDALVNLGPSVKTNP